MVEHYQAYTWRSACDESSLVLAELYLRIPDIHFKRAWPTAQLIAMLGNVNGGKAKSGKGMPDWKVFKSQDFLPAYAWPRDMERPQLLTPPHCAALSTALQAGHLRGASWVVQIISEIDSLERIHAVADEYLADGDSEEPEV